MATPNLYDEKEVMEEFISCYRHFTALWDSGSTDYLSKKKKDPGYQELLKILKRVNRGANVQDVKRKINSLRCCYRREIKKIQMSYEGYEPRLWWFHMMDFLKPVLNLETPPPATIKLESQSLDGSLDETSMHDEDIFAEPFQPEEDMLVIEGDVDAEGDIEAEPEAEVEVDGVPDAEGIIETDVDQMTEAGLKSELKMESKYSHPHPYASPRRNAVPVSAPPMRRRRHSSDIDGDYEDGSAAGSKKRRQMMDQMMSRSVEHVENECDLIGKRMAAHFRNMRPDQRLFAERIISEVLVYGRMNRLSLDARFLPNDGALVGAADVYAGDDAK